MITDDDSSNYVETVADGFDTLIIVFFNIDFKRILVEASRVKIEDFLLGFG